MNVFIVNQYAIPPSLGGLVRHYYFSKYLRQQGHNVSIFSSSQVHNTNINFTKNKQILTEKNIDGIPYTFVRTISYSRNNWRRIVNLLQFPINVVKAIKNLKKSGEVPDVIYLSSPSPFYCYTVMKYAKKYTIPCVLEVRDLWPLSIVEFSNFSNDNLVIKSLYRLEKWLYKHADRLIFTMSGGVKYIKDRGWEKDINISKIHHINNGVDLTEFEYNKANYEYSDDELDNPDYFNLVFTGSVRHIYQLDMIVELARLCQESYPNVRILIFGDGPEKESLIEQAEEYHLNNIIFKGTVDKKYIASILAKADATLLHSMQVSLNQYGISPNKLFEYAAAQKPIISTIQEHDSIIHKYGCGIQINQQNEQEIFDALSQIIELSEEERTEMGKKAYVLAQEHDYQKLVEQLEQVFNLAIGVQH